MDEENYTGQESINWGFSFGPGVLSLGKGGMEG